MLVNGDIVFNIHHLDELRLLKPEFGANHGIESVSRPTRDDSSPDGFKCVDRFKI